MTDDVRAVARRMYEAFNTGDFGAARTIFSSDFFSHLLGTTGPESVIDSWTRFHAAFPDARVVVEDMLIDGDKAAVRTTVQGIPSEGGPAPTMLEIFRVQNGCIAELWGVSTLNRSGR